MKAAPFLTLLAALPLLSLPAPAAPQGEWTHEEKEACMRSEYHNPLNGQVVFIHNRLSAKAAAPFIAALLATPEGRRMQLPDYTLITCYSYDFFGSPELREALRPVLPPEPPALAKLERHVGEAICHLDAVTAALNAVKDEESERFATTCIEHRLPAAGEALLRASSVATVNNLGACAFKAHGQPMLALDRLLHAFGHAVERRQGNCPELERVLVERLREHLEQTAFYDPQEVTPEAIRAYEAQERALHAWFTVAATIHDKAGADAAAAWLEQKNAELGRRLQSTPHRRFIAASPALSLLEEAEANVYLYLANATPAFFGSERLAALYAPEEEGEEAPAPPKENPAP